MLEWFEKRAPIRQKLDTLRLITVFLVCLASLGALLPNMGFSASAALLFPAIATILMVVVMSSAKRMICDPYVAMVVRTEGLAAGDIDSPIERTDYLDCVGRMARASNIFREQAVALRQSSAEREIMVDQITTAMNALAKGNLSYRIVTPFPGEAEKLRSDFNSALSQLAEAMGEVVNSTRTIDTGSAEIRAASDDLAGRTELQAARLEEASAAMQKVTTLVGTSANQVAEINHAVAEAHGEAENGGTVVARAVEAMTAIQQSSQGVSQIINVIDGIAFQTNLLALNAGVEAARAGESGRGFAVVATEVRALAQRSATAASEIGQLISSSTSHVERGVQLVNETGEVLRHIVDRVAQVSALIEGITESAQRQSLMLSEVSGTVSELDRMTQQNAAMVEESTAAARTLASVAQQLRAQTARFQTGAMGSNRAHEAAPAAPRPVRKAAFLPVSGNLALKPSAEADWAEF
ncbi:MAG: methyl-accepting chemotaxis protein [Novosphingobium sp.]|nr:methyl-accepting chemotaxis protein [Novosphingobium sp.]